jgi:hypothetical protein
MNLLRRVLAKVFVCVIVFGLIAISATITTTAAKSRKKPAMNRKKITIFTGERVKVKLKNAKKAKKTRWSVKPAKSVALAKKKNNSVQVRGKKRVKKAILTAKFLIGKKKYTTKCSIKVVPRKVKYVEAAVEGMTIRNYDNAPYADMVVVRLTKEYALKTGNFSIQVKKQPDGEFNKSIKIDSVFTSNNRDYQLNLSERIENGDTVKCSVSGIGGWAVDERQFRAKGYADDKLIVGKVGEILKTDLSFYNMIGFSTKGISSGTIPNGLTVNYDEELVTGEFKEAANNTNVLFAARDEYGTVATCHTNFLIGSYTRMYAEQTTVGMKYEDTVYANSRFDRDIYVAGGSGWYESAELLNDYGGMFKLGMDGYVNTYYGEGYGSANIYANAGELKAGEYDLQIKFTDSQTRLLTAIGRIILKVTNANIVTTVINNNSSEEPLDIYYGNIYTGESFLYGSFSNDQYLHYIPFGVYEVFTYVNDKKVVFSGNTVISNNVALSYNMPS